MDIKKLFFALVICQFAGLVGSFFNSFSIKTWYLEINKPVFLPPNWVFPIVWTILFVIIGFSLYITLASEKNNFYNKGLIFFSIQFILNILWSFLFFTLESPLLGLIGIIFLVVAIIFCIYYFYKINKISAYLLIPYLLWVFFATALNLAILLLN